MKRIALSVALAVIVVLAILGLGAVVLARSGTVNVAATHDYLPGVHWFVTTLSEHSITQHARDAVARGDISPPAEVSDDMVRTGAAEYREMCVTCHGAPGVEPSAIGKGLTPEPPDLAHTARERTIAEIYWVVAHGLRHTGMPAFGPTHSADDRWAIAAFVERLGEMSADDYRQLAGEASHGDSGHTH